MRNTLQPELTAKVVKFYPNPATTTINFDLLSADKSLTLQLFNFMGRKVFETTPGSQRTTAISLDGFFRGVYIYQVRDKAGKIVDSGRFQVVK